MPRRFTVIDVAQVLATPGVRHPMSPVGRLSGAAVPSARVPEDEDVEVEVVLEAQGGAIVADGTVRAGWVGQCRRCLESTSGTVEQDFREVFTDDPVEGETFPLVDATIDLGPVLHETLTLALPLAPLCSEACGGPDPAGHPVGIDDDEDAGETDRPADDRWSALDGLRFDS